jgi:S-adenosylmethionine synthetase
LLGAKQNSIVLVRQTLTDKDLCRRTGAAGDNAVSVLVDTYGIGKRSDAELASLVRKVFPLSPKGMIDHLDLMRPIFRKSAVYGHFGRDDIDFTWENIDAVDELRAKNA